MNRYALVEWLKKQPYVGLGYQKEEAGRSGRLFHSLDRFEQHLAQCGVSEIEATTLEVLRTFEFRDADDDDGHLGPVFLYLGRADLQVYIGQVSADKYFRRKTLQTIFKDMDEMKPIIKTLHGVGLRLIADVLTQGANPAGRQKLAGQTGLPIETITSVVQCCDLCRMTGMAGQALRRSLVLGYDTLAKFRAADPEAVRAALKNHLAQTGERSNSMLDYGWFVVQAQQLSDLVVY